jgi:hypothetical protein
VHANLAALVANHDERVVDDAPYDVVAGCGKLGLVGQEQPRPPEDPLALELEDVPVVIDRGGNLAGGDVRGQLGNVDGQRVSCRVVPGACSGLPL